MSGFDHSVALNDAMLAGVAQLMDAGTSPAYITLYQGTRPSTPGASDAGSTALVALLLARPAATLVDHELVFHQADASGDQILTQGSATWARLFNGAGAWMGDADVTDMAGAGPLKISGTTGTLLYAGARALLGQFKMA